jgi:hypothetical protein
MSLFSTAPRLVVRLHVPSELQAVALVGTTTRADFARLDARA